MRGGASLWDHDLVSGVAFHPRRCAPNSRKPRWVDDTLEVASGGGARLAYRLYLAPSAANAGAADGRSSVLVYFHANAELCTDLETEVSLFHDLGFQAVLAPEFRGYAWGTGKPKLGLLKGDAAAFIAALPEILRRAEYPNPERATVVVHGRSLGAICAVHAAASGGQVTGLIVESGCLSIQELPMFVELGRMMPDMYRMLAAQPDPVGTLAQMQEVTVPTLIIHGDRDEVVPVQQAVQAHRTCGSGAKKLVRYARGNHNDIRVSFGDTYFREVRSLLHVVEGSLSPEEWTRSPPPSPGLFSNLASAFRCLPGVKRCLADKPAEDQASELPAD